jgi:hypothetical protein
MTVDDLVERVQAYEGHRRPGIATLRALVAVRTNEGWVPPATELETLLRQAVAEVPDCPPVLWRVVMPWGEVDGMIPDWGIVLEGDGRRWHARVADFERDRWRDNQAAAHGLRFLRFTWTQLNERRAEVVSTITAAGRASRTAA